LPTHRPYFPTPYECYCHGIDFAWFHSYLGSLPKVKHPHTLLSTEAGGQLLLKGEVQTHLVPLKGQVHKTFTLWLELILCHHLRCHTWLPSTYQILLNSPMILYCTTPHGQQCLPNCLHTSPSLKENQEMIPPTIS
jgi:hypothetical protein